MEKERQGARPPGRAATRGNTLRPERRPAATPARPRAASSRPYRYAAPTPPPPAYIPPVRPGSRPPSRTARKPPPRKPSATPRREELAEERFRDALWPETRETPAQRRAAFLLSLLYALIYAACSFLLVRPLNVLTARMPFPASDVVRAALSALAGTALCALTRLRFPDEPRLMLLAYRRLLRNVLFVFAALQALLWGEWEAQRAVARFTLKFAAAPLVVGTAVSVLLFYLDWLYIEVDEEEDA